MNNMNKNTKTQSILITVTINNDIDNQYTFIMNDWPTLSSYKKFYDNEDDWYKHPTDGFAEYLKNLMPYEDIDNIKASKVDIIPIKKLSVIPSEVLLG
jgi:hypothetical protein